MRIFLVAILLAWVGCSCSHTPASSPRRPAGETVTAPRLFRAHVTGSGEAVIFIPDLGAPAEVWQTTVTHLGVRAESHVLDIAGFAGNRPVTTDLMARLPAEIARYIRENKLRQPRIVGHLFGASVAYALATTDSELLGGVLAIDAPPSRYTGETEELTEAEQGRRALAEAGPARFSQMITRRLVSSMRDEAHAKTLAKKSSQSDQRVVSETFFAMMTRDTRADIPRITTPVLVLLTTENLPEGSLPQVEALYREQLAPIPNHQLSVVNRSRHYVMFDAPEAFFALLDRFLGLA